MELIIIIISTPLAHLMICCCAPHTILTAAEYDFSLNWAFTRYDVVGHSQGGVLVRMLCQSLPNRPPIVGPNNLYQADFAGS